MGIAIPTVGDWYQKAGGDLFEVVAVDAGEGAIEIQYYDGTVEEVEAEAWYEMKLSPAAVPDDYSGSLDLAVEDDFARVDLDSVKQEWADPLDFLDQTD